MECVSGGNLCGIPIDILANLECQKRGKPRWSVFSMTEGLGIKLFWVKNASSARSPIKTHQGVNSKQRKERSQQ